MERINSEIINEFIIGINRGPFLCRKGYMGDDLMDHINKEYSTCHNETFNDEFDCAVYQAWLDLCRTVSDANSKESKLEDMRIKLSNALRNYFKNPAYTEANVFDEWYYPLMRNVCGEHLLTIGQAQKLINMAFKYLFCCKGLRMNYKTHFTYCHMPIDDYTLNWYNKIAIKNALE